MSISAIGPIGQEATVYVPSSTPVSQSAAVPRLKTLTAVSITPFANPAIPIIAQQAAMTSAVTPPGEVGVLEQSYIGAALLTGATSPLASSIHVQAAAPAIAPVAALVRGARPA